MQYTFKRHFVNMLAFVFAICCSISFIPASKANFQQYQNNASVYNTSISFYKVENIAAKQNSHSPPTALPKNIKVTIQFKQRNTLNNIIQASHQHTKNNI